MFTDCGNKLTWIDFNYERVKLVAKCSHMIAVFQKQQGKHTYACMSNIYIHNYLNRREIYEKVSVGLYWQW